jgi:hypothetical protein
VEEERRGEERRGGEVWEWERGGVPGLLAIRLGDVPGR